MAEETVSTVLGQLQTTKGLRTVETHYKQSFDRFNRRQHLRAGEMHHQHSLDRFNHRDHPRAEETHPQQSFDTLNCRGHMGAEESISTVLRRLQILMGLKVEETRQHQSFDIFNFQHYLRAEETHNLESLNRFNRRGHPRTTETVSTVLHWRQSSAALEVRGRGINSLSIASEELNQQSFDSFNHQQHMRTEEMTHQETLDRLNRREHPRPSSTVLQHLQSSGAPGGRGNSINSPSIASGVDGTEGSGKTLSTVLRHLQTLGAPVGSRNSINSPSTGSDVEGTKCIGKTSSTVLRQI